MKDREMMFSAASASEWSAFRTAKQNLSAQLLNPIYAYATRSISTTITPMPEQNVVGVGIGEKVSNGQPTGVPAIKLLVRMKYPEAQLNQQDVLPKSIDGLPVDVEQVGTFRRFAVAEAPAMVAIPALPNPRARMRPAPAGCSIGFQHPVRPAMMAGTFGAVVRDDAGLYILSNNHVLAGEDQLPAGSSIFQPGLLDGGVAPRDEIAQLMRAVPFNIDASNKVDAAIARVTNNQWVNRSILWIGEPSGVGTAVIDLMVHKFGRTTGYTTGRVTSVDTDVRVDYDRGTFVFENQIIIVGADGQRFSAAGDSGSLILERRTNMAVGLLFAGSTSHTIANHLEDVLNALEVTLDYS